MSNVVQLRKNELLLATEEIQKINPDVWVVVGMNTKTLDLTVVGPDNFNAIEMLGMLEFAKTRVETPGYTKERA